jgi:AcrR family transcriptional regulator
MADVKPATRKARAAATRQRIIESAHRLFLEQGYAATTMPAVAAASGVAVQTVYFIFRTKGDLLHAVFERVVLGPAGVPPHLMPWWPAADDGHKIEESVRRFTGGTAELLTRAAPQLFVQYTRDLSWTEDEFADWATTAVLEQVFGLSLVNPARRPPPSSGQRTGAAEERPGT